MDVGQVLGSVALAGGGVESQYSVPVESVISLNSCFLSQMRENKSK